MPRLRTLFFTLTILCCAILSPDGFAQSPSPSGEVDLTRPQDYVLKRVSSYDRSGGNADYRKIAPGQTLTVLDVDGPATLTHIWFTLASDESYHLKKIVLRMYWDGETTPSVETPLGDFFGLGLGEYYTWESELLSVARDKALNSFFPMPFQKHALITITNEGKQPVDDFYFNLDYRALSHPLPADTLYFHAQYRQAQPNHGSTNEWVNNGDPRVLNVKNLDGKDMYFIDGETHPSITGTGSEDYFLGAYDFGRSTSSYRLFGARVVGDEHAGTRTSAYRFHLDSPITFTKSLKATIEHGHANHRSDNFYSVAYWYQTEPHAQFPTLPSVDQRVPRLQPTRG